MDRRQRFWTRIVLRPGRWATIAAALLLTATAVTIANADDDSVSDSDLDCESVEAEFTSAVVSVFPSGAPCPPGTVCSVNTLTGDVEGFAEVVASEFVTSVPGAVFATSDSVFFLDDGDTFTTRDVSAADAGNGEGASNLSITGGTGALEGATGRLIVSAIADLVAVTSRGEIRGEVCTPDDDD